MLSRGERPAGRAAGFCADRHWANNRATAKKVKRINIKKERKNRKLYFCGYLQLKTQQDEINAPPMPYLCGLKPDIPFFRKDPTARSCI
jgi:hypothetical protein